MNPINRVGQKVVCITPPMVWFYICPSVRIYPRLSDVYTVAAFETLDTDVPGIRLRELEGFTCECGGFKDAPWPITGFKPVDERKTDISVFTQILDKTPEKVRA
jgi:hypothetical protein